MNNKESYRTSYDVISVAQREGDIWSSLLRRSPQGSLRNIPVKIAKSSFSETSYVTICTSSRVVRSLFFYGLNFLFGIFLSL